MGERTEGDKAWQRVHAEPIGVPTDWPGHCCRYTTGRLAGTSIPMRFQGSGTQRQSSSWSDQLVSASPTKAAREENGANDSGVLTAKETCTAKGVDTTKEMPEKRSHQGPKQFSRLHDLDMYELPLTFSPAQFLSVANTLHRSRSRLAGHQPGNAHVC